LRLRRASSAEVQALDRQIFSKEALLTPDEMRGALWWVAVDDGDRPFAFGGVKTLFDAPDYALLVRAGTLHRDRGRGAQRRLISARLRWARARGAKYAITYTAAWNHASANNLIGAGFLLYKPEWRWAGEEYLYWQKSL
jgi:GNAT superfamily N-acetyltransferase